MKRIMKRCRSLNLVRNKAGSHDIGEIGCYKIVGVKRERGVIKGLTFHRKTE
jgi:hypothetical protein